MFWWEVRRNVLANEGKFVTRLALSSRVMGDGPVREKGVEQMKTGIFAGAAALAVAGIASAGFVGLVSEKSVVGGKNVYKVYAQFNSASDVVLSCFGISGFAGTTWNQADFVGGSWNPQFTSDATVDSFVTIGGTPGFSNSTSADPNWGALGFNQQGIPNNAGWFNSNPPNLQGKVDASLKTLIAQFVYTGADTQVFTSPLTVSFNQGLGTPTQFSTGGSFTIGVPAPGAVALLGLAGLAGRRRRA